MNQESNLIIKHISDIEGEFIVKDYQRGYRWDDFYINKLLDDIWESAENEYFLQPIVVGKEQSLDGNENRYELIDGQQRLTTIYLIYKYLDEPIKYFICYSKKNTAIFLNNINSNNKYDTIDNYYIYEGMMTIQKWFDDNTIVNHSDFLRYLNKTRVIWYEISKNEKPIELFKRLNIGRIPLTSSELVKATFLGYKEQDESDDDKKILQTEIAMQWDEIEKELHREELWSFLTADDKMYESTRIDLILDLITKDNYDENEKKYSTFFYVDEKRKNNGLRSTWNDILLAFYTIKGWYDDLELYHKIGYLIYSKSEVLHDIYEKSISFNTKIEFKDWLDSRIKYSLTKNGKKINFGDLSYDRPGDYDYLFRILLLFNIESVRLTKENRFPFDRFKGKSKDDNWSMEHIHAQNSDGLDDRKYQHKWLMEHRQSVVEIYNGNDKIELLSDIDAAIDNINLKGNEFEAIFRRVIKAVTEDSTEHINYLNSLANLALLNHSNNAALSKSTFDVKRRKIKELEINGDYIPYCTKMVFLKYYSDNSDIKMYYWGIEDMKVYLNKINDTLEKYLDNNKIDFLEVNN